MLRIRLIAFFSIFLLSSSAFSFVDFFQDDTLPKNNRRCTADELVFYNIFMDHNQEIIDALIAEELLSIDCQIKMSKAASSRKNDLILCGKVFDFCEKKTTKNKIYEGKILSDDGEAVCGDVKITINTIECEDYIK